MDTSDETKWLGQRIKQLRERQKGLTKAKLARAAGISEPYMLQIEKGDRQPSVKVLKRLAAALDEEFINLYSITPDYDDEAHAAKAKAKLDRLYAMARRKGIACTREAQDEWIDVYTHDPDYPMPVDMASDGSLIFKWTLPEGWKDLDASEQRLIRQLIKKLVAAREAH